MRTATTHSVKLERPSRWNPSVALTRIDGDSLPRLLLFHGESWFGLTCGSYSIGIWKGRRRAKSKANVSEPERTLRHVERTGSHEIFSDLVLTDILTTEKRERHAERGAQPRKKAGRDNIFALDQSPNGRPRFDPVSVSVLAQTVEQVPIRQRPNIGEGLICGDG